MRFTALMLAAQLVLFAAFLFRSDKRLSDYPAFYAAARLWQKGENPFYLESQCREQAVFRREECLPYVHPPILLPVLSLLTTENFTASYWRWTLFSIVILLLCIFPLVRLTGDITASIQAILWQPIIVGVWIGQDNALLFAAVVLFMWLIRDKRDFLAGVALSLATIKPHFAIALAIPLLFSNRNAFAGFTAGSAVLILYSVALVGLRGVRGIMDATLVMAQSDDFGVWREGMCNLAGFLARSGVRAPALVWSVFLVSIGGISYYWHRKGINPISISIALVIVMLTAPHVHPWDIAPLAVPLALSGTMPLMITSLVLFAVMPFRLLHLGCYVVFGVVWAQTRRL